MGVVEGRRVVIGTIVHLVNYGIKDATMASNTKELQRIVEAVAACY
jgi:hypothetical protein